MNAKKKLIYSIDFALLVVGILLSLISGADGQMIKSRFIISTVFIVVFYFLFPFLEYEKKEKIITKVALHCLFSLLCLLAMYYSLSYYVNHISNASILGEILSAMGLLYCISYIFFIFIGVLKTIYSIGIRIKTALFQDSVKSNYSKVKKMIEGLTALFVAAAAMFASISALVNDWKGLLK